jgi:hypothetical protein
MISQFAGLPGSSRVAADALGQLAFAYFTVG